MTIAVVMAVYQPNVGYLRDQIASLARQTHLNFEICFVIADDQSHGVVRDLMGDFTLQHRYANVSGLLNSVQAFEAGLTCALDGDATHIALCDQDDIWHPERLEAGLDQLQRTGCALVHCDAQVVDAQGQVLHTSLFAYENRLHQPGVRDLLYRNTVTGMTCLMTRDLATRALPFPGQDGLHFHHDLWLALVAMAEGGLRFIPRALVAYRQHDTNAVGAGVPCDGPHLKTRVAAYGLARYLAEHLLVRVPCASAVRPFRDARSWGGAHLWDALRLALRGKGALARTALWFGGIALGRRVWALRQATTTGYRAAQDQFDQKMFQMSPGLRPPAVASGDISPPAKSWWAYADGRMEPTFTPHLQPGPPRMVILVPTLNPTEVFAGVATAIDLGLGLARRGHVVRFIATDLPMANRHATRTFIRQRAKGIWARYNVDVHCGVTEQQI
ncbi:MAG: glycosyltransferase, partial [Pseudomonadota bacterium]